MKKHGNYYIAALIDGRQTPLAAGPKATNGGFSLAISMRNRGDVISPVVIEGKATKTGKLTLTVNLAGQKYKLQTVR